MLTLFPADTAKPPLSMSPAASSGQIRGQVASCFSTALDRWSLFLLGVLFLWCIGRGNLEKVFYLFILRLLVAGKELSFHFYLFCFILLFVNKRWGCLVFSLREIIEIWLKIYLDLQVFTHTYFLDSQDKPHLMQSVPVLRKPFLTG